METFDSTARSAPDLAVVIADARIAQGVTQAELAERIGATRAWVSQFENGKANGASLERVMRILEALRIDMRLRYPVGPDDEATRAGWVG